MLARRKCATWVLAAAASVGGVSSAHAQATKPEGLSLPTSTTNGAILPGVELLPQPVTINSHLQLLARATDPNVLKAFTATFNVNAADTTNADVIQAPPYNLDGSGLRIGVFDPGGYVLDTHQELTGRVEFGDFDGSFYSSHATHVAGTIAATGVYAPAKGMAPQVQIRTYTSELDTIKMAQDANDLVETNHSYGFLRGWTVLNWTIDEFKPERTWVADRSQYVTEDPWFGKYDNFARELDTVLHDNPRLLSVWSAGNDRSDSGEAFSQYTPYGSDTYVSYLSFGPDGPGWYRISTDALSLPAPDGNAGTGYDSLPQQQVSKNNLVVGAINQINDEGPTRTGTMTPFSAWGPTDDGRLKPDVVADGVNVTSSIAIANDAYATASGTSMAAPNVTGTMALVIQHLMQVRHTSQYPLSATSKAIAIHTAHDVLNPGPDYQSGYGVLDGEAAVKFIDGTTVGSNTSDHIIESTYAGTAFTQQFSAIGGEVKATLVWNDVPHADSEQDLDNPSLMLVNDLDIWITDELNHVFHPWTLDPANPDGFAIRTERNFRDNVEQILIDNFPTGSIFTVHIDLNGELTGLSQDWSLLLSGGVLIPEPNFLALAAGAVIVMSHRRRAKRKYVSLELSEG